MKVYIVTDDLYERPIAVFSDEAKAAEFIQAINLKLDKWHFSYYELELDKPEDYA